MGIQQRIDSWTELGADKVLIQAIKKGVKAPLSQIPTPDHSQKQTQAKNIPHYESLMQTIGEYCQTGAIRALNKEEADRTRYWIPVFGRPKRDSDKISLITDLRGLNKCHKVIQHKPHNWSTVMQTIREPGLTWELKLDLKGYYHHLRMNRQTQRRMGFRINDQAFQIIGMPFGWASSPYWANKLAQPVKTWLNQRGWAHLWWVDDILILGETKEQTEDRAAQLIELLTKL
jgi:hypothetical protein